MRKCIEGLEKEAARGEHHKEDLKKRLNSIEDDRYKLAIYSKQLAEERDTAVQNLAAQEVALARDQTTLR